MRCKEGLIPRGGDIPSGLTVRHLALDSDSHYRCILLERESQPTPWPSGFAKLAAESENHSPSDIYNLKRKEYPYILSNMLLCGQVQTNKVGDTGQRQLLVYTVWLEDDNEIRERGKDACHHWSLGNTNQNQDVILLPTYPEGQHI